MRTNYREQYLIESARYLELDPAQVLSARVAAQTPAADAEAEPAGEEPGCWSFAEGARPRAPADGTDVAGWTFADGERLCGPLPAGDYRRTLAANRSPECCA